MTYLYAGLGIAMISGIAAMMQITNNINTLYTLSVLKDDLYSQSNLPSYDKNIMKILYGELTPNSNICDFVKEKITNPIYENGENFLVTGTQTLSVHPIFKNSCALVSKDVKHRILIIPLKEGENKYGLFSCLLSKEPNCPFEINQ